jgi:hypothetical protein
VRAHREAERLIGVPADRVLKLPAPTDAPETWNPIYQRLGAPADPKEYDFTSVKKGDGSELDAGFVDFARAQAAALHLPKDKAAELASGFVKFQEGLGGAAAAEKTANLAKDLEGLKQSWGPNFEANTFIVNQAALKLGLGDDVLKTLRDVVGGTKVAQALLSMGQKMGEDKFVANGNPNAPGVMTVEQAQTKKNDLKGDSAFVKRYLDGDVTAKREMEALDRIIWAAQQD